MTGEPNSILRKNGHFFWKLLFYVMYEFQAMYKSKFEVTTFGVQNLDCI